MPSNESKKLDTPEAIKNIGYWKKQIHVLLDPVVILALIIVSFTVWQISSWYWRGIVDTKQAEIELYEAKIEMKVKDADLAIQQMKSLGLTLAGPMLDWMSENYLVMGRSVSVEEKIAHVQEIEEKLRELGVTTIQITKLRQKIDKSILDSLRRMVLYHLREANSDKKELFQDNNSLYTYSHIQIEKFAKKNELKISTAAIGYLEKMEYFSVHKTLP